MRTSRTCVAGVLAGLAAAGASGQTWDGGAAEDFWTTRANWSGNVVPINNGTAAIVYSSMGNLAPNSIVNQNWSIASLAFTSGATAYLLNGIGTLTIGSGGITNNDATVQRLDMNGITLAANQTWNASAGPLTIAPNVFSLGTRTLTVTGSFDTTIATNILQMTGTGSVIKNGTGTLFWNGGTYGGNVVINAGELDVGNIDAWSATTDVSLAAGATLDLSGWGQGMDQLTGTGTVINNNSFIVLGEGNSSFTLGATIRGSGEIRKRGTGTMTLAGANQFNGTSGLFINGGAVKLGLPDVDVLPDTLPVTIATGATLDMNGTGESFGSLAGNGAVNNAVGLHIGNDNASTTFTGDISGALGWSVRKYGTGTWTLGGTISGGSGLEIVAGVVKLAAGVDLANDCDVWLYNGDLDMNSQTEEFGNLRYGLGCSVLNHNGTMTINVSGINSTFQGTITGANAATAGAGSLVKKGSANWTLEGSLNITGNLDIQKGLVTLGSGAALNSGLGVIVSSPGVFNLNGRRAFIGSLAGNGNVINNNQPNGYLRIVGAESATYGGQISGTSGFVMAGTGVQELTGFNSFSGGSGVLNGTLLVNSFPNTGLGTGIVVVRGLNVLPTLGGDGRVSGATTVGSFFGYRGRLAPGGNIGDLSDAGSLEFGTSLAFEDDSILEVELGGANPGSQYDQVIVSGPFDILGTATLNVVLIDGFVPTPGQSFTILIAGSRSGQFGSLQLPPGFTVSYDATSIVLTYNTQPGDADGD